MNPKSAPPPLNDRSLLEGVAYLCENDSDLKAVIDTYGNPPLWDREPGFSTLLHIILEQQVSLASANAAFRKLKQAVDPITPERFLKLSEVDLKSFGFSRQKIGYGKSECYPEMA